MIGYLRGHVIAAQPGRVIVQAGDVGYEAMVGGLSEDDKPRTSPTDFKIRIGDVVSLWVWHHQTEKAVTLYGFTTIQDRELAILIGEMDGIGPVTASRIVQALGYRAITRAIVTGDVGGLSAVKGVGIKKMGDVLTHLKESKKFAVIEDHRIGSTLAALRALGHNIDDVEHIVLEIAAENPSMLDISEMVRETIKRKERKR